MSHLLFSINSKKFYRPNDTGHLSNFAGIWSTTAVPLILWRVLIKRGLANNFAHSGTHLDEWSCAYFLVLHLSVLLYKYWSLIIKAKFWHFKGVKKVSKISSAGIGQKFVLQYKKIGHLGNWPNILFLNRNNIFRPGSFLTFLLEHFLNILTIFYAPTLGLSWKTNIRRTE